MGILNITPDSFADGGRYNNFDSAIAHGLEMLQEGVDIIDVGGESTRPGALRISADEEESRILPVIKALAAAGALISIDTQRAQIADKAVAAGAKIINDVSAGLSDKNMLVTVASLGTPFIAMHSRGESKDMNSTANYGDVTAEVLSELQQRVCEALTAGILKENLILDPGLGFAKRAQHNWDLLKNLDQFMALGYPILIGASRKRFLGSLTGDESTDLREPATIALTTLLAERGIWGVRVHGVKAHRDAIAVVGKMQ